METLRTPDSRFEGLPGYAFAPHYHEIDDGEGGRLRVHYLDEGSRAAHPVLLLHGEPSWSYVYRNLIPVLVAAGHRVIAPDLVGFGRSDKPVAREDYTYSRHVDWMRQLVEGLDLRRISLVCHDWGGLIGLRLLAEHPGRFARVVASNTFLPTGDAPAGLAFLAWQKFSQEALDLPVGRIVSGGCTRPLSLETIAAYDAPFPEERFKSGARQLPLLVPTRPDDPASEANRAAWLVLESFEKPFLTAFSDSDPITRGGDAPLRERIPGALDQPHATIHDGGHFLQEDQPDELARVVTAFFAATR